MEYTQHYVNKHNLHKSFSFSSIEFTFLARSVLSKPKSWIKCSLGSFSKLTRRKFHIFSCRGSVQFADFMAQYSTYWPFSRACSSWWDLCRRSVSVTTWLMYTTLGVGCCGFWDFVFSKLTRRPPNYTRNNVHLIYMYT